MARNSLLVALLTLLMCPQAALAIFYGEDDYLEIDHIPQADSRVDWREIARSVAVIVPDPGDGEYDLAKLKSLRSRYRNPPLAADYKYGEQPSLARLTAFLIAPDKIMTAGHVGKKQVQRNAFLFDFTWDSEKKRLRKQVYQPAEIYRCQQVLLHRNDALGDYCICQLDRPVVGRTPLKIKVIAKAADIDKRQLKMIGAPDGIPLKLTNQGQLFSKRPSESSPKKNMASYFFHDLDNSYGNSGSPIFDAATGRVIGIQSGGDDNFTKKKDAVHPTCGDFRDSNLGRPLKGEWGSLIPNAALKFLAEE